MKRQGGFSLIELMTALAIGAMLLGGVYQLISRTMEWMRLTEAQNRTTLAARFAFDRMVNAAAEGRVLILPLGASVRNHFAVTLPGSVDRNGDGYADADNDFDRLIDEDLSSDMTLDGANGLREFDDDVDGADDELTLELLSRDDDEDGTSNEDSIDSIDNDGDGRIDEDADSNGDEDGDGRTDEDGYDAVLFHLTGTTLVERVRVPWDTTSNATVDGRDYVTSVIAENVTLFETRGELTSSGWTLLHLKMNTLDANGAVITLETSVRVGSRA